MRCCAGFRLKLISPDDIFSTSFPSRSCTVPVPELSGLDTADAGLDTKCGLDTLIPDFVRCMTSRFFRARDSSDISPARSHEPCNDDAGRPSPPVLLNPEDDDVSMAAYSSPTPSGGPPEMSTVEVVYRGFGVDAVCRSSGMSLSFVLQCGRRHSLGPIQID